MTPVLRSALVAVLVAAATAGCATTGAVPRPFPGAAPPVVTGPPLPSPASPDALASPVVSLALSYRGVPYRNGGSDPTGFDCSGFVQWVFAQHGRPLPREVRDQYQLGTSVDRSIW